MVHRRRTVGVIALICVLVALASSLASASEIAITPAGSFTASSENLTFTSASGNITCPLTFSGTLAPNAAGTLTRSPSPESNPQVGSVTSGRAGRCSTGTVTLLAGGAARLYVNAVREGEREREGVVELYAEHVTLLVDAFIFARCQYDARLSMSYSVSTGSASIVGLSEVRSRTLGGGICPERPDVRGTLAFSPRQVIVNRLWRCMESRNNEVNRIEFPMTTPGTNVTQGLICTNESGGQLTVAAGSAITGTDAAKFNLLAVPANGTNIANGGQATISINFAPPAGTPSPATWQALFTFNTVNRGEPFLLRGST